MNSLTSKNQPDRPIEPTDKYGLWEKYYGRSLSEEEKIEITTNLSTFFGIIIDEHKKLHKTK